MSSPFETLYKMLTLEKNTGCLNKAVMGGVERIPEEWGVGAARSIDDVQEQRLAKRLMDMLQPYPTLGASERRALIDDVMSLISPWAPPQTGGRAPVSERVQAAEPVHAPTAMPPLQPASRPIPKRKRTPPSPLDELDAPVDRLSGISTAYSQRLARLGVQTVGDVLTLYPRRYIDYRDLKTISQLCVGDIVSILATVWDCNKRDTRRGRKMVQCTLGDDTGTIQLTWFNQPWIADKYRPGMQLTVSGKVEQYLGRLVFNNPEVEVFEAAQINTARIVPVYPLTEGVSQRWMRWLTKRAVDRLAMRVPEFIPHDQRTRAGLLPETEATAQIHFPKDPETLEAARRRLAFDELLFVQLGVMRKRRAWRSRPGKAIDVDERLVADFLDSLPYQLTNAQRNVLTGILDDLARPVPMNRLLQGDVGSGKTVVALAAMLASGGQAALMAPTEILAEQHYNNVVGMMREYEAKHPERRYGIRLLTGSTRAKARAEIYGAAASGAAQLFFGTHALIQENVEFADLRLAVVDEQHRFGVQQRALLRDKGHNPHVLVMSATPIPRSLALTLYGDLDLSIIDEMPPGRQKIETRLLQPWERDVAYRTIRTRVEQGQQAFVICPLVEESETIEAKSAIEEFERLSKEVFPDLKLGLVHGRMKAEEKEKAMHRFRDGMLDILVSTAVVEVGIDVPNATVMLVEGANRFGLAQLHQFRGRVGRGKHVSLCLLVADVESAEAQMRLETVRDTSDGFKLAEEDLKLRGPGEFFGTRQSGLPDLKLAKLSDVSLLEKARSMAREIFEQDPTLAQPQYEVMRKKVDRFWREPVDPN